MKEVTDPNLLAELNGSTAAPVSDPELLAQLNGDDAALTFADRVATSLSRGAGLAGRYMVEGATALPAMAANVLAGGSNALLGTNFPDQGAAVSGLLDKLGLPKPETGTERVVGDISRGIAGVGSGVASAGTKAIQAAAPSVAAAMKATPVAQALMGGAGAGSAGIAEQAGAGPVVQAIAGLGGALVPGGAVRTGQGAAKAASVANTLIRGRTADQILATRLSQQNLPAIKEALRTGSEVLGLADVAGDEAKGLLRLIGRTPGGAKDYVSDFLQTRSEESVKRVSDLLSKNVSNVDTYFGNLDDVAKARAVQSAPLYKQAYSEAPKISNPELKKFLMDRRVVDAIDEAKRSYGVKVEAPSNSLETLDGVKKVLGDKAGEAYRAGKPQLGSSYTALKNQLVTVLDDASPTYKKARKTFAGYKEMEEAQEAGLKFSTQTPEQLRRTAKEMTPSELDAFKIGIRENLQTIVSKTADGADPAKRIFGNSYKREQLEAVLGSEKSYKEFTRRLNDEIAAADTKFKVLGGSRTDINLAEDGSPLIEAATNAIRDGKSGVVNQITDALAIGIEKRFVGLDQKNSQLLAKMLTDKEQGIDAIDRLIKLNEKNARQTNILKEAKQALPSLLTKLTKKGE